MIALLIALLSNILPTAADFHARPFTAQEPVAVSAPLDFTEDVSLDH